MQQCLCEGEDYEEEQQEEMNEMPVPRDTTMLKPNSKKFLTAMAEAKTEPKELAQTAISHLIKTIEITKQSTNYSQQ